MLLKFSCMHDKFAQQVYNFMCRCEQAVITKGSLGRGVGVGLLHPAILL